MRARTLTTTVAGVSLAAASAFGLSACSSTSSSSQASASAVSISGSPVNAKDDLTALCKQIVDQKLTLEAANALAESGGNTTRVIKKDGEDLPATTDLNETRLNFEVNADVVTACTVG
jgi:prophage DNA circulation protein